jgi:hypothetical protein
VPTPALTQAPTASPTPLPTISPTPPSTPVPTCVDQFVPVDICVAIDQSGSICNQTSSFCSSSEGTGGFAKTGNSTCCQNYAVAASFAVEFVTITNTELNGNAKIGVVRFATDSSIATNLTTSADAVMKIRTTAYSGGGTNTAAGINSCRNVLASGTSPKQILVLLTDGIPSGKNAADTQATGAKSNNITLIPVGVGTGIDTSNLQGWGTNGYYLTVSVFDDLPSIIGNLTDTILCPK